MLSQDSMNAAVAAFEGALNATAGDIAAGDVAGEEDFTGQMLGRCKERLGSLTDHSIRWQTVATITEEKDGPPRPSVRFSARQTTSKGGASEEWWSGADLLMALDIRTKDYEVRKGVLVQAKRLEPGTRLTKKVADDLRGQCRDMLNLTPSSFVFLYAKSGVTTLSASVVEASQRRDLHALEQWQNSTGVFFVDFLKCWVGDPRLAATDRQTLAVLRALADARNAVLFRATEVGVG
ncbi:hypothetical protein M2171_004281 [Bradyrhizobium japonicum USDA 38]|uniref:hypothetical protein n=1 Tax=Bradyrhizobium japonicum TaxID=375 RepID=UPI00047F8223|nr:hypothetical protein [Bradyrhizobium japonicum]MCS3895148.1 hypothetical protein [Bradyrhizobium japonicum USDA 38]MCS3947663.1 hypothetical protein [Bradyrhizobium japonicum]